MKWTRERPTAPGWYWYKDDVLPDAEIVRIGEKSEVNWKPDVFPVDRAGCEVPNELDDFDGEWAGPIAAPEPT